LFAPPDSATFLHLQFELAGQNIDISEHRYYRVKDLKVQIL